MNAREDPARGTPEDRLRVLDAHHGDRPDHRRRARPPLPPGPELPGSADPSRGARVRAELSAAPAPAVPAAVLSRLEHALADEATRAGQATETTQATQATHATRPARRRALLVAAVGTVLVVLGLGLTALGADPSGPPAAPVAAPPPPRAPGAALPTASGPGRVLAVRAADLPAALRAGLGRDDYGFLADPARRASCLTAHGPAAAAPVGARTVVLDGRPGVLLVLTTGVAARFRLLVVGEACAAGTPATLADTVVGPGG